MNSIAVRNEKRRPWWVECFKGWSYIMYEMMFQKLYSCHLKNPLPLPSLNNVNCIVTGSTSGIGLEIAKQLAFSGAHVVMAVRNVTAAYEYVEKWRDEFQDEWHCRSRSSTLSMDVMELNLLSLNSVVKFADKWNSGSKPLHVLINNAGIFSLGEPQKFSTDGYETHMQVNHFAPALLSIMLLPSLIKGSPSRIINVNSTMHTMGFINTNDMNLILKSPKYTSTKAYSNSKLAQVMFSSILQRHLPISSGIHVICVSPGSVRTNVTRNLCRTMKVAQQLIPYFRFSPGQGARSALYAATSPKIPDYCRDLMMKNSPFCVYISYDCNPVEPSRKARKIHVSNAVWERTLDMIGLPPDVVERLLRGDEINGQQKTAKK